MRLSWILLSLLFFSACGHSDQDYSVRDPHSYAQPSEARVTHMDLDMAVDFEAQKIRGTAILSIHRSPGASEVWLDTKDLTIEAVLVSTDGSDETVATYELGERDSILGRSLRIELKKNTHYVHVTYETQAGGEALQFLPPSLTADKEEPFLLTQSQSIFARSWVPIQDSPGIRFTYHATVMVPKGLLALMSAENPREVSESGVYEFTMSQPIPAYLLALAVGKLEFKALGERSGVYAEPSVVENAAYEFAELEQMMTLAEQLYGPYKWGRYDVIVLPPSFPFGGMENPRLTFATPTIIAGDRSLVSLIAHELAHSWSGNLVTNATWNDFWLNEGFTVYFENRIMEALKGREYSEMLAQISYEDLKDFVERVGLKDPDTRLALDLEGRNPDDGMTSIAYDKGYFFLRLIEESVGRKSFDAFLRSYFEENSFKTMTTKEFLDRLETQLLDKYPGTEELIQPEKWVYETGIPDNIPFQASARFTAVEEAVNSWIAGVDPADLETVEWSSHEWQHFIRMLPAQIRADQLQELDEAFHFTESKNAEIQAMWYLKAIQGDYEAAYPAMRSFLTSVGRRKFLNPLYRAMLEEEGGREMALDIYQTARNNYHPLAVLSLDELLTWQELE